MSGNPNTTKLGKRKVPLGAQNPSWLFPSTHHKPTPTQPSTTPMLPQKLKEKEEKKLADDLLKKRAAGKASRSDLPAQLVDLVCEKTIP